ncbi:SAM-dependent methyltransferase [Nocardia donostiensis]|uniref:SAM-dependent methyltransferase n=1 Tax=Nocardia donostiensis TaxID=1538463 RepID=UPI0020CA84A4|nr:SAM-dependent methyltransferase [Nocardia donostiensis]
MVYVDNDPVCVAHGMAYWDNDTTRYLRGNLLEPFELLNNPQLRARIYLSRPVGVLICGLLHHIPDDLNPAETMQRLIDLLPDGSHVMITHYWAPDDDPETRDVAIEIQQRHLDGLGTGWFRSRDEIAIYLPGLELLAPGLVEPDDWWPAGPQLHGRMPEERLMLVGVGYKRHRKATQLRSG